MVTSGYRQPFWKITMQTICFKASIVQLCNQPWTINHVKSKRAQLTLFKQYSLLWINTNMQLYSIWMNCVGVENNGKKKQTKHLCANTVQYWTQTVCTFKVYSFLTCMQCHALYFKLDVLLWWVLCAVIDTRQPPEGTAWTDFIIYRNRRVQRHQMKYWTDTVWRIVFNLKTVLLYIWFKCVNSGEEREGEERGGLLSVFQPSACTGTASCLLEQRCKTSVHVDSVNPTREVQNLHTALVDGSPPDILKHVHK